MGCEGANAHVRVRAKCILKCVRDVHACGPFWGLRCAITLSTLFFQQTDQNLLFYNFSHSKTDKNVTKQERMI